MPGIIQGYVWSDTNWDGLRQDLEGYSGVFVSLYWGTTPGMALTEQRLAVTDQTGFYRFGDVDPGQYQLFFDDPQGRIPETSIPVDGSVLDTTGMDVDLRQYRLYLPLLWSRTTGG